jgi:cellulose synthase/poly-beta-1,6-N-acetylglucosamine synthase-like glycosyltransferase
MFDLLDFSINYNSKISPTSSARLKRGKIALLTIVLGLVFFAFRDFYHFAFYFILAGNIIFSINFVFKLTLFAVYLISKKSTPRQEVFIASNKLPIYTILLPCFKEERETLQNLIASVSRLNYKRDKLDIKFLLEEEDKFTQNNLSKLKHDFEVVIVPKSHPKTKPKACNYGLYLARGEFVVIYDAEDKPNANQLLDALSHFNESNKNLICVQCRLNFYNLNVNLLSRCFSLEYLTWFNVLLPSALKLKLFIPLGGTSNHFKTSKLIEIGGWDPYNVTEDAELGVRISKKGYKTSTIESYTLEEAPFRLKDWMPQRQRWMKGYLQTFLSHLLDVRCNIGWGFWQFFGLITLVGFSFISFFMLPFVAFLFLFFLSSDEQMLYNLMYFNSLCVLLYMVMFYVVIKKERFANYGYIWIIMIFYFIFHSFAAILGFWQFFSNTFHWNKTPHGVKNIAQKPD